MTSAEYHVQDFSWTRVEAVSLSITSYIYGDGEMVYISLHGSLNS